jgi:glycosyltransferase involved in cell wall biosynthesis
MKVLHIAESIRGGCGTYLNEIVPLQAQALGADQVRCLVPQQHAEHLVDIPSDLVLTFNRPRRMTGLPRLATSTVAAVRQWQPDLIHAHSTFAGAVVRLLSNVMAMPPIVYCPHGWVFEIEQSQRARAVTRLAERLLARSAHKIVAISDAERLQGEQAGIPRGMLTVVPNGINAVASEECALWNDARRKVLFVGRLDWQKGVDILLDAVQTLGTTLCVRIVGEQVLSGKPNLATSNRAAHVEFLGWRNKLEVTAQINACDLVVMPSRWEGFGLVAVEAMRAGKPVVAAAVGGLSEIVVEGTTGRLVPPGDAASLATALTRDESSMLKRMGEAGRARFLQHYTSDRTSERLMQLYAEVLQPRISTDAALVVSHTAERIV